MPRSIVVSAETLPTAPHDRQCRGTLKRTGVVGTRSTARRGTTRPFWVESGVLIAHIHKSVAKSMRVRLIKKFAEKIDGVDLTGRSVGDLLNLLPREARLLIAEEWAVPGGDFNSHSSRADVPGPDPPPGRSSAPTFLRRRR